MFEKNTGELRNELKSEKNINHFIEQNEGEMDTATVPELLTDLLAKHEEKQKSVIKRSQIPAGYAYQIFEGRKNASRDKLIKLALAFPLTVAETNRLIRQGGYNELYVRNKRDVLVIYSLEKKLSVGDVNELLYSNGEELL
ncbi:MAG: XRE family transcriptional regulator [Lachnospiraceae bacterium]|nr:XRE family transcriptional regulator [Lachnospiraceae bacterium]MCR5767753.1 XRE family transcriptional regulator [Lachnospiraceae bacterium]